MHEPLKLGIHSTVKRRVAKWSMILAIALVFSSDYFFEGLAIGAVLAYIGLALWVWTAFSAGILDAIAPFLWRIIQKNKDGHAKWSTWGISAIETLTGVCVILLLAMKALQIALSGG